MLRDDMWAIWGESDGCRETELSNIDIIRFEDDSKALGDMGLCVIISWLSVNKDIDVAKVIISDETGRHCPVLMSTKQTSADYSAMYFLPVCWQIHISWGGRITEQKEKEELSAFSPSRYFYNILTFINHIRGFDNLFSALGSSSLLPTPSLKLKLVLRIWIWYLRPLLGVFNLFFNWNLDPIFLQGRRSQTKCRSTAHLYT